MLEQFVLLLGLIPFAASGAMTSLALGNGLASRWAHLLAMLGWD